jgi:hypothetical protein
VLPAVEEFFLHLWDDFDDVVHTCRHLAVAMAVEMLTEAAPLLAAASGALLAGAATLLLSQHPLAGLLS